MLSVHSFTFNPFYENTYIVFDDTLDAVVIDPGCYEKSEQQALTTFVTAQRLNLCYVLLTHSHIDHVLGVDFVKKTYQVPLLIHRQDEDTLRAAKTYAPNYGFISYCEVLPDRYVEEGETISWGNSVFEVLFLPGHAPGHIGFYAPHDKVVFGGDVLFKNSVGRTDLPGADADTLMKSIREKLYALPDYVKVYPGHGDTTTIGEEKIHNPFCPILSSP